jgi:hexosaminidase
VWASTGQGGCNASPLFTAVYGPSPFVFGSPDPAAVAVVIECIDAAIEAIARAAPAKVDGAVVQRELTQAARLARLGATRLLGAGDGGVDIGGLLDEQRACWRARARPGGLDDSLARLAVALGD